MNKPRSDSSSDFPQTPARPAFGFLLGGTTLGIFFGCVLLALGAKPPDRIIICLAILGAITGAALESLWPKLLPPKQPAKPIPEIRKPSPGNCECKFCGEIFPPEPVTCPMCGHHENR